MKLLLSILILTLLGTSYTQERPGFIPMDPEDYTNNTLISTLQDAGTAFLLDLAYRDGRIANQNFTWNHTNYILNRTTNTIWYFDFNVSLVNAENDSVEAAFVIWYFPENETNRVGAHTYSVDYGSAEGATNPNSTYVPVPEEEYDSELIQTLANFGKDFIVDILISRRAIAPGDYEITEYHSVLKQELTVGARYQFDINFAQEDGSNLRHGEYRILYLNATEDMEVMGYRFSNVTNTPQTTDVTPETDEIATETTETETETDGTVTEETAPETTETETTPETDGTATEEAAVDTTTTDGATADDLLDGTTVIDDALVADTTGADGGATDVPPETGTVALE